jgi:hypothetical protein
MGGRPERRRKAWLRVKGPGMEGPLFALSESLSPGASWNQPVCLRPFFSLGCIRV